MNITIARIGDNATVKYAATELKELDEKLTAAGLDTKIVCLPL